mmetsp:Transcript_12058/g.23402  ORF Transcript_12058/g.23402 Transcript_12058/m.23402 type:complete len:219 (+) Transcript_12058:1086-1742(+)
MVLGRDNGRTVRVEVVLLVQSEACLLEQINDFEGDSGRAGDARRVDARRQNKISISFRRPDDPVALGRLCARTGKRLESVVSVEAGNEAAARGQNLLKHLLARLGVGPGVGPFVHVARGRTEDQVAPQRLLHQDTLAQRSWAREEDVVALVSRRLFEQDVLSEPRLDLKRVVANHLGQAIRRAAGAVHNVPGAHALFVDDDAVHSLARPRAANLHVGD